MYRTRVGYAGGSLEDPTYRRLGDHTETIQIDFDPNLISYGEVLLLFWDNHNPSQRPWSRQYMSIIFTHDQEQLKTATSSKKDFEKIIGGKVYTEIISFERFYLAEDYHQKYYLQSDQRLFSEIQAYYKAFDDLVDSTVAARLNGYVAGYGDLNIFQEERSDYGLSQASIGRLQNYLD